MVGKAIKIIGSKISSLHTAAYLLASFTLLSQILALIRDRFLANFFGAGVSLDVYYAAFRIPDFIFITMASLVSLSVLIPLLTEKIDKNTQEGQKFVSHIFTAFLFSIIIISFIAFLLMPTLVRLLFPGFEGQAYLELVTLSRIMLLSPILLGFSNLFSSVVQVFRRFFIYALSPIFYNLGIILGIFVFVPIWGLTGLAWGVVLGALFHLLVQIPFVYSKKLIPKIVWPDFGLIKKVFVSSVPRTLALGVNNISVLILISIGSLMVAGSISVFNFSFNLQSVPLAIVGVSYSLAAFPTLSKLFVNKEMDKFYENVIASARHIIFWSIPITVIFIVLRAQIVRVILGSGQFNWDDTRLTAASLAIFSISVLFQSLVLLFVRSYYATSNTRTPLIINVFSGICVVAFAFALVHLFNNSLVFKFFIENLFRVDNVLGTSVLMLPLGYSIAMILNGVLLFVFFARDFTNKINCLLKTFIHIFSASVIMGSLIYLSLEFLSHIVDNQTFFGILSQGLISALIGIVAFVLILVALKNLEIKEIYNALHKRVGSLKQVIMGADAHISEM